MKKNKSKWQGTVQIHCTIGTPGQSKKAVKNKSGIKLGVIAASVIAAVAVPMMAMAAYGDVTPAPPAPEAAAVQQTRPTQAPQATQTASTEKETPPSVEEGTEETTGGTAQGLSVQGEIAPSVQTSAPSAEQTATPSGEQTAAPSAERTSAPSAEQTATPSAEQTAAPSAEQTAAPSAEQTAAPSAEQTPAPSGEQTPAPSGEQTAAPSAEQTTDPQDDPAAILSAGADVNLVGVHTGMKSTLFTEELVPDQSDPLVAVLQVRLMELGYMEQDEPTELYGPLTTQAVTRAQRCNGLPQTGTADLATIQALMAEDAKPYEISSGAEGDDVREAQLRLQIMDYLEQATGYYGTETVEAVRAFQKANGLAETGVITLADRQVLLASTALCANGEEIGEKTAGAEALIAVAEQQLGKPYSLGAKGADAFDCSGLVYYCLNQSGYSIGYMTSGGWASSDFPTISSMDELQRGDIVCFTGHVGIYIGDGQMIDASTSENRMKVSSDIRSNPYWSGSFLCGKRIF